MSLPQQGFGLEGAQCLRQSRKAVKPWLLWCWCAGEFSFAVVQANTMMEDFGSVNSTSSGTFVGLYDGHGGEHASHFLSQSMAPIVQRTLPLAPVTSVAPLGWALYHLLAL